MLLERLPKSDDHSLQTYVQSRNCSNKFPFYKNSTPIKHQLLKHLTINTNIIAAERMHPHPIPCALCKFHDIPSEKVDVVMPPSDGRAVTLPRYADTAANGRSEADCLTCGN